MPSPIGHGLAGVSVAWLATPRAGRSLAIACALLAASPDIDVLFGSHRGPTHSLAAVVLVSAAAAMFATARKLPAARVAAACGLAYASHLVLDWLGKDSATPYGIMALWPFSSQYFSSEADLFLEISRRYWNPDEFIFGNVRSLVQELVVLLPLTAIVWWIRRRNTEYRMPNTE
jgi:inner membrane protein